MFRINSAIEIAMTSQLSTVTGELQELFAGCKDGLISMSEVRGIIRGGIDDNTSFTVIFFLKKLHIHYSFRSYLYIHGPLYLQGHHQQIQSTADMKIKHIPIISPSLLPK